MLTPQALAVGLLPRPNIECETPVANTSRKVINLEIRGAMTSQATFEEYVKGDQAHLENILGCAIKTGRIKLYMMPFFITNLIEFLLQVAGLIAVLFMVYGGYLYSVGGITEDKESGKNTIKHALIGLVVSLSSWIVVNLVQLALTS